MFRVFGVAAALLVLWPATALASGLAFRDERTISVTLAEKDRIAPVSICNTGRRSIARAAVTVKGLGFVDAKGEPLPDTRVIVATSVQRTTPPRSGPLLFGPFPAGRCRTVILRRPPARGEPAAGTYDGIVAAVARGGGLARRRLRVTVKSTEKTPSPTTALDADVRLVARTTWPLVTGDAKLGDPAKVALVREVQPDLPKGCTPTEKPTAECLVGNVSHGTDVASVYIRGNPEPVPDDAGGRAHVWRLPLLVEGAGDAGEYKGALDFGPGGEESKPKVTLTLAVGDHHYWPILFLLVLQAIGVRWLWWQRRHTPHQALEQELDGFVPDYAVAAQAYHEPGGPGRHLNRPTNDGIEVHAAAIRAAVQAYHDSTLLYDPTSTAYKAILASIDEVHADIASWASTLGPAMDALHAAVVAAVAALPERTRDDAPAVAALPEPTKLDVPALVRAATALLAPQPLAVGEAVAWEGKATELTATLRTLEGLLTDLGHGYDTLIKVHAAEPKLNPAQQQQRERASAMLDSARWRLWQAKSAEELDAVTMRARISAAQVVLDTLLPDAPPEPERAELLANLLRFRGEAVYVERLERVLVSAGDSVGDFVGRLIDDAEAVVGRAARSAVLRQAPGKLLEGLVFLVSAAAAVILAVFALSIGDTFGTVGDYLKLFAAAVTGPAVGAVALAAVGRLRALRSDPLLRSEAEPASVHT